MTQESTEINYPTSQFSFTAPKPNYMLSFHNEGTQVGTFDLNEGKMHFEGELTESGKVFVDWVLGAFKQRLDDAVLAEREACATVCDSLEEQCEKLLVPDEKWPTPADCANIIRARGQA
jgi:hypothetical protein